MATNEENAQATESTPDTTPDPMVAKLSARRHELAEEMEKAQAGLRAAQTQAMEMERLISRIQGAMMVLDELLTPETK